jgi:hypothetical protein
MRGRAAAAAVVALLVAGDARADGRSHFSVGAGGWSEPIHLDIGFWGGVEYWPVYGVGAGEAWWFEAGVSRALGEARPHLLVALHAGAGYASPDGALLLAAGLASELGLKIGPLALGLDGTFHSAITRERLRFALTGILALHATW